MLGALNLGPAETVMQAAHSTCRSLEEGPQNVGCFAFHPGVHNQCKESEHGWMQWWLEHRPLPVHPAQLNFWHMESLSFHFGPLCWHKELCNAMMLDDPHPLNCQKWGRTYENLTYIFCQCKLSLSRFAMCWEYRRIKHLGHAKLHFL